MTNSSNWSLTRSKMTTFRSRYSGPEPQILPFPPELVVHILSYLDQVRDKQNARLVSKGFAAAGLAMLTSTAYLSTSLIKIDYPWFEIPKVSSPILEMAKDPIVSRHITKLVCDGSQFPSLSCSAFQNWWSNQGKNRTSKQILRVRSEYASKHSHEKWIISNGEDRRIFLVALERFVNLKSIVFTDVIADEQDRYLPRSTWPSRQVRGDLWNSSSPYHNFSMCIRSLSKLAFKLDELSIVGRRNAISYRIFSPNSWRNYRHLLNVSANLRKIYLDVNPHDELCPLQFGIGRFLTNARMLHSLDLNCVKDEALPTAGFVLSRVFNDFKWPHLKHIGLSGFKIHTDVELIAFFERHRATLDSVSLNSIYIHQNVLDFTDDIPCQPWKHLFGELRKQSITFQRLALFEISDCCNPGSEWPYLAGRADRGTRVLQYLRDGGPNPFSRYIVMRVDDSGMETESWD